MSTTKSKYSSSSKKPGKTKAFFICLIISSFLWLIHALNTVYTKDFEVPVSFKNLPQNKKPQYKLPSELTIKLKASGLKLALILLNKPFHPLEIDFNNLKSINRNQNYILSGSPLNLKSVFNFETQIKQIIPDTLYFSEKSGFQKTVPVKVPLHIKCKEGYGFNTPRIVPSEVVIWGDSNSVNRVDTMYTQSLSLTDLKTNYSSTFEILRPSADVYSSTSEAEISIEVNKLFENSILLPISDIKQGYYKQINIFPSRVTLKYTSLAGKFNTEDTLLFKVNINSEKINKQNHKCPVFVSQTPGNVTVMEIEPKEVEILIIK